MSQVGDTRNTSLGTEMLALKLACNADAPICIEGAGKGGSCCLDIERLLLFTDIDGHQGMSDLKRSIRLAYRVMRHKPEGDPISEIKPKPFLTPLF